MTKPDFVVVDSGRAGLDGPGFAAGSAGLWRLLDWPRLTLRKRATSARERKRFPAGEKK